VLKGCEGNATALLNLMNNYADSWNTDETQFAIYVLMPIIVGFLFAFVNSVIVVAGINKKVLKNLSDC
jgi:hypothetical protein